MQAQTSPKAYQAFVAASQEQPKTLPERLESNPENMAKGVAQLVLTLVELIRQLMEKQAIRRLDTGSLSDEEAERMGETFMLLEEKVAEMKALFGLEDEDLEIGLGSVRDLL